MTSIIRRWILARVVKSALVFEQGALEAYQGLKVKLAGTPLLPSIEHLLEEEELHLKILSEVGEGRVDPGDIDRLMKEHAYEHLAAIEPLDAGLLGQWKDVLDTALAEEEKTFIFYSNLRRMSKIPSVKKAFGLLADMEKEHVTILRRFLGRERTP